jgi:hypothetical protein
MSNNPPNPRLALAVGIVGHRPERLPEGARVKVAAQVGQLLETLAIEVQIASEKYKEFFSSAEPLLSLVSGLAEGADRIAADAALARGFVLDAVLPFPAAVYKADFKTPESCAEFESFMRRARSVLVLPGQRTNEIRAYTTMGLTVLDQSDILLAIWDHGPSIGGGGTTEMIKAAVRLDIPIIETDAHGKTPPRLRWSQLSDFPASAESIDDLPVTDLRDGTKALIEKLVVPPGPDIESRTAKRYLTERFYRYTVRLEFPLLLAVCGVRSMRKLDWGPLSPDVRAAGLLQLGGSAPSERAQHEPAVLAFAYGWADAVGIRFAQIFRSAFVTNFLFAAVAVVIAASSLLFEHDKKHLFVLTEFLLIGVVLINTVVGRLRGWHHRWFEPREVAERLRSALALWMLGARPTSFSGPEPAWTGWYVRAICREQSLRSGLLDEQGLSAARACLLALLDGQCDYHRNAAMIAAKLERRLERFGLILFGATVLAAALFLTLRPLVALTDVEAVAVTVLTAGLPALATAAYGIRIIGDFDGVARRSERTHQGLKRLIDAVKRDPLTLDRLRLRARGAAEVMMGDISSWRIAAESRSLNIPG